MKTGSPPEFFLSPSSKTLWGGLVGSSSSFALTQLFLKDSRPFVVLCPTEAESRELFENLQFFFSLSSKEFKPHLLQFSARESDLSPSMLETTHRGTERLQALHQLVNASHSVIVITSLEAISQYTLPMPLFFQFSQPIQKGKTVEKGFVETQLQMAGYERETVVVEKGSFAIRGGIVDFFPPHFSFPVRMEWMEDQIESLRTFDPNTQRSMDSLFEVLLFPCREILLNEETSQQARSSLKELADSLDLPPSARQGIEEALDSKRYLPAMNSLLPLFYSPPGTFFDYCPPQTQWVLWDSFSLDQEISRLQEQIEKANEEIKRTKLLRVAPSSLFLPIPKVREEIHSRTTLWVSDILESSDLPSQSFSVELHTGLRQSLQVLRKKENPLAPLVEHLQNWSQESLPILIVASGETSQNRLFSLLEAHLPNVKKGWISLEELIAQKNPWIVQGQLSSGFRWDQIPLVVVTETEIFGERKHTVSKEISREDSFSSLEELRIGEPVVHLDHGIGLYQGLQRLVIRNVPNDFIVLEYAGGDKLYLPIYRLNRIHKYIGGDKSKPRVDRLGNQSSWERYRARAQKAAAEMAEELLQLYAARQIATTQPLSPPDEGYFAFEEDFPFEETRDQLRTLEEVTQDLLSGKPMDRLVCGDVGFGKTEIALRGAFRMAMEGKQVAVLVPTTVLAQQHFETFRRRMKSYPIQVEVLSRFKTPAQQKVLLQNLKEGKIDIVVGTHRLLSKDVSFPNLGLLIIDEEHRFGVKHKEQIQKFRNQIHVLTLTATPIPRTLQLSMAGIRDLSVINTPPLDRKAIQTFLCKFEDSLIRNAIRKELSRGGQVFFIHNRVETIYAMKSYLSKQVPEARVEVAHGQMSEKSLEKVMVRFLEKEFDVLLSTTIVESGLDIPTANTMIINRADTLGLAQLYQLRGRVGRSDQNAYAYLLVPGEDLISRDSLKRLKALKRFTELGSGLKIALHDLEIRGAGNLLGANQSGFVSEIGLELYTQLLDREVRRLKGQKVQEEVDPDIHTDLPAFFPEEYVPHTGERLQFYKRLSSAKETKELDQLREELKDRFGELPPTAENLFRILDLKVLARKMGILSLRLSSEQPCIEFSDQAHFNLDRLLMFIQKDKRYRLRPDRKLMIEISNENDSLEETKKILLAIA